MKQPFRSSITSGKTAQRMPPLSLRQRGSIAMLAAILIPTMVILLTSIDIGFLFYQKRELQKVADMAALAGAQQLAKINTNCTSSIGIATDNARVAHDFSATPPVTTFIATCGRWDPAAVTTAPHYLAYAGGQPAPNAVRVDVSRSFGSFFGAWADQRVGAMAIATTDAPIAVFSVGSRLLQVHDGVVPAILSGMGININGTAVGSYEGLANAKITTSGLLSALGFNIPLNADVATIKSVIALGTPACNGGVCPLNTLLGAISTVGGQQDLVNLLGITANNIQLDSSVPLLSDATGRGGIFALADVANGQSALNANINALEVLTTAIGVANSHRALDVNLGIGIPGVISAESRVGIVEPPSIGIGGVGTTAFTSQVRLFSRVGTSLPNSLLNVDLPLVIDVINGQGTITAMCNDKDNNGNDTATIAVNAPILRACVGNFTESMIFSIENACDPSLGDKDVLTGMLKLSTRLTIDALPSNGTITLSKGQTVTVGDNNLQIGATLANISKAVTAGVLGKLLAQGQGVITNSNLATGLLGATGGSLDASLTLLNDSATSLKNFANGFNDDIRAMLAGSLTSGLINLLNETGGLVSGLLNGIEKALDGIFSLLGCLLTPTDQCKLKNQLSGNQSADGNTISNVLLSLLALVEKMIGPILDNLGSQISSLLGNQLGIGLGQVDVTLIDLNCGGGENVRLVH